MFHIICILSHINTYRESHIIWHTMSLYMDIIILRDLLPIVTISSFNLSVPKYPESIPNNHQSFITITLLLFNNRIIAKIIISYIPLWTTSTNHLLGSLVDFNHFPLTYLIHSIINCHSCNRLVLYYIRLFNYLIN